MLVLSRKKNESIVINDNINIVVVEIRGDKVRLGVEAPKEIPVHRREVYEAIMRDRESALEESSVRVKKKLNPCWYHWVGQQMRRINTRPITQYYRGSTTIINTLNTRRKIKGSRKLDLDPQPTHDLA